MFITLEKRVADCVKYDPMEQWDGFDEEGHARIDPDAAAVVPGRGVAPAAGRAQPRGGGQGVPDEDVGRDQTKVGGRDGVLDDWGRDVSKPDAA